MTSPSSKEPKLPERRPSVPGPFGEGAQPPDTAFDPFAESAEESPEDVVEIEAIDAVEAVPQFVEPGQPVADEEMSLPTILSESEQGYRSTEDTDAIPAEEALVADELPAGPRKSDDLATNTLAELYIAQGFYDKAIEIYDRMLAENPGHQGLIDILARVRAQAGSAEGAGPAGPVPDVFGGAGVATEYVPPPQDDSDASQFGEPDFTLPRADEAREYVPPPQEPETVPERVAAGFDLSVSGQEDASAVEPYSADVSWPAEGQGESGRSGAAEFVPREYVPPGMEVPYAAVVTQPDDMTRMEDRKRAIERLEQWLRNIVAKER